MTAERRFDVEHDFLTDRIIFSLNEEEPSKIILDEDRSNLVFLTFRPNEAILAVACLDSVRTI